ncbi:MAG: FadR/GntR family transcriptional regulator [Candidatus Parcubacteria bacterium]|nr:FadR/GntR family transcriptional regulator [Candidatus Parcubacteria bacterium]
MSFKTIKKKSNLVEIVRQIKEQMKNGILKPGEKLPSERNLAIQFGVSRALVREAVKALSFSGYLKVIQGKGTYILDIAIKYDEIVNFFSEFSNYSLDYLMEARIMLEGEFARLAALNASQEEIEVIEEEFKEMTNSEDVNTFFVKDLEFHLLIAKATHNPFMNGLMKIIGEMLFKETEKIIDFSKDARNYTTKTIYNIVKAIKERNSDDAKKWMIEHIESKRCFLKKIDNE